MIKRVLIVSAVVFLLGLIIFWLLSGGIAASARSAQNFLNPVDFLFGSETSTGMSTRLPWQLPSQTRGPDISGYVGAADQLNQGTSQDTQATDRAAIEAQYGPLIANSTDPRTFGNPSPYVGHVAFADQAASESDPAKEYLVLNANTGNSAPISISGWSLQSAASGLRINFPLGAPSFVLGVVNNIQPIYLQPGDSVIATTGISPVGTSFRENICSGYLGEVQTFTPQISSQCPYPSETLPKTADNIRTYGDNCFQYLSNIPPCAIPNSSIRASTSELTPACRSFLANTLSYNGCVQVHSVERSFALPFWRVYLGQRTELWNNTHDVIRLLDEKGQVVDVLTY